MLGILMLGGGEIILLLALLVCAPVALAALAFWIWMLVDAIRYPGFSDGERIAWVLVIIFLHFLGALVYFFAGRSRPKPAVAP